MYILYIVFRDLVPLEKNSISILESVIHHRGEVFHYFSVDVNTVKDKSILSKNYKSNPTISVVEATTA